MTIIWEQTGYYDIIRVLFFDPQLFPRWLLESLLHKVNTLDFKVHQG